MPADEARRGQTTLLSSPASTGPPLMDAPSDTAVVERAETAVVEGRPLTERRTLSRPARRPRLRVVPPPEVDPGDLKNPALYVNRELSWLEFNQRVLDRALDTLHPLLERIKFLAIAAANLDEFFMIRISTTQKNLREGFEEVAPDGLNTQQQLEAMRSRALRMLHEMAGCWGQLRPLLADERIVLLEPDEWSAELREHLHVYFSREVCPVLTPLAFDPGHPFPLISNLSKNFAVVVRHGGRTKFARVKVPGVLPRFVRVPAALGAPRALTFVFVEDVIRANLHELFPGTQVKGAHLFRVVRDADLEIEQDEADDLLETVETSLKQLRRGAVALLQVGSDMPSRVLNILIENFEMTEELVERTDARVGFGDWMQLTRLHRPELKDAPFSAPTIWARDEDPDVLFDELRYQDQLVHHPYQSFTSVEAFLRAAVRDPHVAAIKMTLYRIGANSPLVDLLIDAAEAGKQVAVLVELKARFDERNNIQWARRLESHGIHVVYGFPDVKTHAKLCLVVRQEPDGIQMYVHTATGNYNVLYRAAQAGVSIDLLVRGICALRPGVPGVSDNIRVRSIVGRFLEHSRVFWFKNGGHDDLYIGSADLMERNLDRRIETLTPVRDADLLAHLRDVVLGAYLRDTNRAMVLEPSGHYSRVEARPDGFNAQDFLLKHYAEAGNDQRVLTRR